MENEITEKEAVTRASKGQLTICSACYDIKGKIVMVKYDTSKQRGIVREFCPMCRAAMEGCYTCKKR